MKVRHFRQIAATLLLLALVAFPLAAYAATPLQGNPPPTDEYDETLENMTYLSDATESGVVELEDGQFEDADNMIFVTLASGPRAFGDVDGDGELDAVVWLATNTGGSGVFVELAVVSDVAGDPVNVATTLLGDRTQVQSIAVDDEGVITVEVVTQGPEDPMCCPSQVMRLTYILDGEELALVTEEVIGTVDDDGSVVSPDDATATEESSDTATSEVLTDTIETGEEAATGEGASEEAASEEVISVEVAENPFDEGVLENATYLSEFTADGEVTLVDGVFEDTENNIRVELLDTPRVYGDVDGDGVADAVVVLYTNSGGSGSFYDLAVVLNQDGVAYNADSELLGDRVDVQTINLAPGGVITVRMVTQGPDEPMCCGTLLVDVVYEFADDTLTLVEVIDVAAAAEAAAEAAAATPPSELEAFTPAASPIAASLALDSANPLSPDPALVTVIAGPGELFAVDAVPLGEGCAGWIPPAPHVTLQWNGDDDALRFFTVGEGDPTLLVVTPDGSILCNDDVATEVFNPLVVVENPQPGRYAIFTGIYDPSIAPATSLLVITSRDLNPTTYTVALPIVGADASEPVTQTLGAFSETALDSTIGPDVVTIAAADLPVTADLVGGGDVSVFEEGLGNTLCTGFASSAPLYQFELDASEGELDQLVLFYEADVDTTLIVEDPNGAFQCNDDNADYTNLNPVLSLPPIAGTYAVWIGTYATDTEAPGLLTLTSDGSATPALLSQ